ncbi:MAG: hypothetical protein AAFX40_05825 [Cyanobacteria bacterium J06639_1]
MDTRDSSGDERYYRPHPCTGIDCLAIDPLSSLEVPEAIATLQVRPAIPRTDVPEAARDFTSRFWKIVRTGC